MYKCCTGPKLQHRDTLSYSYVWCYVAGESSWRELLANWKSWRWAGRRHVDTHLQKSKGTRKSWMNTLSPGVLQIVWYLLSNTSDPMIGTSICVVNPCYVDFFPPVFLWNKRSSFTISRTCAGPKVVMKHTFVMWWSGGTVPLLAPSTLDICAIRYRTIMCEALIYASHYALAESGFR